MPPDACLSCRVCAHVRTGYEAARLHLLHGEPWFEHDHAGRGIIGGDEHRRDDGVLARGERSEVVVVVNNGQYTILKAFGDLLGVNRGLPGLDLPGLDVLAIATGLGAEGRRITAQADFEAALTEALAAGVPDVLDVHVDAAVPQMPGVA